jgi:ATP-dependent Lon protease
MNDKTTNSKKETPKKASSEIVILIEKKLLFFQDVIQKTILHVQKNKILDIIGVSEVNSCINTLFELSKKIKDITETNIKSTTDNVINILQTVNNELSTLFKIFGTDSFEDLLWICFGNNSVNTYAISDMDKHKFELLKKYFHPTSYKLLGQKKDNEKQNKVEETFNEKSKNLDSSDISIKIKPFHLKVYGIQIIVHNPQHKKSLIITGTVDDIMIDFLNNKFVNLKTKAIKENAPHSSEFQGETFDRYIQSLNLKDYLIFEPHEIYSKYAGYLSHLNTLRQKTISQVVKEFVSSELYLKRTIIIQLLVKIDKYDNQYLAYLLYDLLSNDTNGSVDTQEQTIMFDSFPWSIKQYFKDAMKRTVQYTNDLANFDIHKIPLEQQICLLKVADSVKEKAMQKLKEIKAKSEDSGSKARQYLDGLLKIPFNIYRKEPILNVMNDIKLRFNNLLLTNNITNNPIKENYTSLEIAKSLKAVKQINDSSENYTMIISEKLNTLSSGELKILAMTVNGFVTKNKLEFKKLKMNGRNMKERIEDILGFVNYYQPINKDALNTILKIDLKQSTNSNTNSNLLVHLSEIEGKYNEINKYMANVKDNLDKAVHGHDKAKKQIERIIGQWINGKQDGYCFGFEGPPGIGKTSLAKKGLSDCLKDENGVSRPFAMIQMGGDANGSSLHGHNYTYVGSTWGSIVQILIDKKCMNPIIFIDEIDKISKTEHGKEIVGILTHLLDPAQNDCFQDKYFSGIELDLSKALFILSYNDVEAIDKILIDRVHRIKFKSLTLEEKLVISTTHILPEVYDKMGLQGMIVFSTDVLKFVIDEYTSEPGVRKLKEILFEIVGEINLEILKNIDTSYEIPINITSSDIKTKYFKDKHEIKHKKIHTENKIGIINGLWANAQGKGGVIPIQSNWRPSEKFLQLHLTGMQGDVMKESMNVALTLAWSLTPLEKRDELLQKQNHSINGVHIHCPEGSTPKDGPSAGTAITTTIYSLFNNRKIKYNIAITGEITLDGNVTEIGGLDLKFLGGIKAGVTEFIYPKENQKDYDSFMEKYKDDKLTKGIKFYSVETIEEVFELVFED